MSATNNAKWEGLQAAKEQLDAAVAEAGGPDTADWHQIALAAQKIVDAVRDTNGLGMEAISQLSVITAKRIFWEWGVFDAIPPEGSISYLDLAAKVDTEVSLLTRVAAVLVSSGNLEQIGADRIAHNHKSLIFINDTRAGFTYHMAWENALASYSHWPQYFQKYGRKEPQTQNHVPVTFANGTPELTYYEVLRQDHPRMERFSKAMAPLAEDMPITGIYDFGWLVAKSQAEPDVDRVLFVDVGGGQGQSIKAIHKENPSLPLNRYLLQDLAEVLEAVKKVDDPELREVPKMAIDFHQGQPVKGALVYWIRRCLHNYSDAASVNILKHLAEAMAEDSKILIEEDILDYPPNHMAAVVDLMMVNFGGKQRTLECWERVASEAGLRISAISRGNSIWHSIAVIECVRKSP
ncbi:O-methyltransferase [Thozetella sp. PMI_491]|nr:O-methyltransferase [Thozetella sp. PMI_491]